MGIFWRSKAPLASPSDFFQGFFFKFISSFNGHYAWGAIVLEGGKFEKINVTLMSKDTLD